MIIDLDKAIRLCQQAQAVVDDCARRTIGIEREMLGDAGDQLEQLIELLEDINA